MPSFQRVRSRCEHGAPTAAESDSLVRLFCTPHLPRAADLTLQRTLLRHSVAIGDGKCRRIDSATLSAIVGPLAHHFDQMSAQSEFGPYAFAHAIHLTARTLGAQDLEPAVGQLLMQQIPSSSHLSPAAQIQLPGSVLHGVGTGVGWGASADPRPPALLLRRLLNPANWYQSPDWIASLFRGGVRALQPGVAGGTARVRALFDHIHDRLPSLPARAIPAVVQGFLDASVKHGFDTEQGGRTLLAHPAFERDALGLAAVALGLARHYGAPTHAQWKAFDALARRAAATEQPEAAFALGCAVAWAARSAPALLGEVREGCRGRPQHRKGAGFARAGVDAAERPADVLGTGRPSALQGRLWALAQGIATIAGHPPDATASQAQYARLDPDSRADAFRRMLAVLPVPALCDWLPAVRQTTGVGAIPEGQGLACDSLEQACTDLLAAARAEHPPSELSLAPVAARLHAAAVSESRWLSDRPASDRVSAMLRRVDRCAAICREVLGATGPAGAESRVQATDSSPPTRAPTPSASPSTSPSTSPPGSPGQDVRIHPGRSPGLWDRITQWLLG